MTPEILCEIEDNAVIGNWIVNKFKLTGGFDILFIGGQENYNA